MLHRHITRPKTAFPDLAGAAQYFMRWLSLPKRRVGHPTLQLLESVSLTAQASIALIRFEQETLVLGVTTRNVTVLARSAASGISADTQTETGTVIP
jgi:flagellar biogenesis protein FliO